MDGDRLWVSVYEEDDESVQIWHDAVGVPSERIVRFGKEENYWDMGTAGPNPVRPVSARRRGACGSKTDR